MSGITCGGLAMAQAAVERKFEVIGEALNPGLLSTVEALLALED